MRSVPVLVLTTRALSPKIATTVHESPALMVLCRQTPRFRETLAARATSPTSPSRTRELSPFGLAAADISNPDDSAVPSITVEAAVVRPNAAQFLI